MSGQSRIPATSERKWKVIKWSAGLLSLYLDQRLRKQRASWPLDIKGIDMLMRRLLVAPKGRPFSEKDRKLYEAASSKVAYWHGTGRFQHDKQGGAVDVLECLLSQGEIRPFKDNFDFKRGEMLSISVARHRMYGRIYGDMHAYRGAPVYERYGSTRFWAYYFIMAINLHAIKELGLWNPKKRRQQEAAWREQGKAVWAVKVTKQNGDSAGLFFASGSDIPGNYPVLIGISRSDYQKLPVADYVARYETRIGSTIPVSAWTHLEVPAAKIVETTALVRKHGYGDMPVFPIEQCERLAADRHFSQLVAPSRPE